MWHISRQKCCLNFSDQLTLPLSDKVLIWQKAGSWLSVIWWAESGQEYSSHGCKVCKGWVMLGDSNPTPPQRRTLWQGEGAMCHPVHVLHVICCTCWWHCQRREVHQLLPCLCPQTFSLMHGVCSWLPRCQEISCYSILIEFSFFTCFVENMVSQGMQHCCKSFVTFCCMRRS